MTRVQEFMAAMSIAVRQAGRKDAEIRAKTICAIAGHDWKRRDPRKVCDRCGASEWMTSTEAGFHDP